MPKHNKTGRNKNAPRHVRLHHWVIDSPAYRSLSLAGRCLLVELYAFYNGSNNGDVFLSCRLAADRLHIGKSSTARAFRELIAKGFIKPKQRGAFSVKMKPKFSTTWVLTEFPYLDKLPTMEFRHWQPPKIHFTVPPQGQTVPPQVQMRLRAARN